MKNNTIDKICIVLAIIVFCIITFTIREISKKVHNNNKADYYQYCVVMQSNNISNEMKDEYSLAYWATTDIDELSSVERNEIEQQVMHNK